MRALKKTGRPPFTRIRKNNEVQNSEASKRLFKVVVYNYKQQDVETLDQNDEEPVETVMDEQQGLPPQPTGYIKYPTYDWF